MSPSTVPLTAPEPAALRPEAAAALAVPGRGRASWSGLLRLSLVTLPVKAYPAAGAAPDLPCHQLHAGCGQRIRHQKHCPAHGPVDAGALVSGYEYAPGQFLVLDGADLDRLRPADDRALCLEHFLDAGALDPVLFSGRSLYLLPDGPAAHLAYAVLVEALHERHKAALGRVVLSQRRQLVLVRPASRLLAVHVLHYPAQLRSRAVLEATLRPAPAGAAEGRLANWPPWSRPGCKAAPRRRPRRRRRPCSTCWMPCAKALPPCSPRPGPRRPARPTVSGGRRPRGGPPDGTFLADAGGPGRAVRRG